MIWAGGAASAPTGDTKDGLETGWLANIGGGITVKSMPRLGIGVDGFWGSSDVKGTSGSVDIGAGLVGISFMLVEDTKFVPYLLAGGGVMRIKPEVGDADNKGAYQVGGGLATSLTPKLMLWADVRYLASGGDKQEKATFLPIAVGLAFPFGGGM